MLLNATLEILNAQILNKQSKIYYEFYECANDANKPKYFIKRYHLKKAGKGDSHLAFLVLSPLESR